MLVALLTASIPLIAAAPTYARPATGPFVPAFTAADTLIEIATERFTLFGYTRKSLEDAKGDVEYAVKQFRSFFGSDAPPIAVIIFDSAAQLSGFDFAAFRARSTLPMLPWLPRGGDAAPASIRILTELGVAIGAGLRVTALNQAARDTARFLTGDIIKRANDQPIASLQDFDRVYGAVVPGTPIRFEVERAGGAVTLTLTKPRADTEVSSLLPASGSPRANSANDEHALSHEAGHMLLISWANEKLRGSGRPASTPAMGGTYGHPAIPDWFDETIATLCELPALQNFRREAMWQHLAAKIPFSELFRMEHPLKAELGGLTGRRGAGADGAARGGGVGRSSMNVQRITIGGNSAAVFERSATFYSEVFTLSQFIIAKEGPRFIGQIGEGLLAGDTMEVILSRGKQLPRDVTALEAAWLASVVK